MNYHYKIVKTRKLTDNDLEFERFRVQNKFIISPKEKETKDISNSIWFS